MCAFRSGASEFLLGRAHFFRPDTHRVSISTSYFDSAANFDPEDGTFVRLGDEKYYKALSIGVLWDQVVSKRAAWRFGFNAAQSESFDGSFVRKNSALTDIMLGYQFFWIARPFKLKPELFISYPVKSVEVTTDESIASEGVPTAKLGLWMQKKWLTLDNYAYVGATYRAEGRSALAEYAVGTKKDLEGLEFGAEVRGFESVTDDEFTDTPTKRTVVTDKVNGGSLKYYGINPSLLSANFTVGLQMSDAFSLQGGYGFDIQGKSMAKGTTIFFNLIWDLNATHEEFTKSRRKSRRNQDVEKFNVEATEYDESLFREEKPKPVRKKGKKPKKSVDQILNEAEEYLDQ